jgi:hypothetical protein
MGYTHYWRRNPILPLKEWQNWVKEIKPILADGIYSYEKCMLHNARDLLCDVHMSEDEVSFNGVKECERFGIKRIESWNAPHCYIPPEGESPPNGGYTREVDSHGMLFAFCKTYEYPYDDFVEEVLFRAKDHFGDQIRISNDGGTYYSEGVDVDFDWD